MDATHFDRLTKFFAARRVSRRTALHGGAGLATVAALAALRATTLAAEGATPAALGAPSGGSATSESYLFLQSFETGSLVPKNDGSGTVTLTLGQGLGDTIYFADRPQRDVGALPTAGFLDHLGFAPPPNAALVAHVTDTHQDIVVLALLSAKYDEATHTATYTAKILRDTHRVDMVFSQTPDQEAKEPRHYGHAHLFIDDVQGIFDCPDTTIWCFRNDLKDIAICSAVGILRVGTCASWSALGCALCHGSPESYCQAQVSACSAEHSCIAYTQDEYARHCQGGGG